MTTSYKRRCPSCMDGDRQLKASHGVIAMGNMVDTLLKLLKLRKFGLETDDTASMLLSAFTGVVSTPGGNAFWVEMDAVGFWGEDLRFAVNNAIDKEGPSLITRSLFLTQIRPKDFGYKMHEPEGQGPGSG